MIYPNTQPSGVVGGGQGDNRRKLQQMLSKLGAAPLFGGSGRSASVASLPSIGAPALNFNPFLKMLAGRPGETFNDLPAGLSGAVAAGIQNGPPPSAPGFQGAAVGAAAGQNAIGMNNPGGGQQNLSTGYGHYNDRFQPAGTAPSSQAPTYDPIGAPALLGAGIGAAAGTQPQASNLNPLSNASLYHTLLQLQMYGMDR